MSRVVLREATHSFSAARSNTTMRAFNLMKGIPAVWTKFQNAERDLYPKYERTVLAGIVAGGGYIGALSLVVYGC